VPILAQDTRHAIGHVGLGNMKLLEFFSSEPQDQDQEKEIDWLGDLKFFVDNDDDALINHIFPAVDYHKKNLEDPKAYKIYVKPLRQCAIKYCKKFDTEKSHRDLFPTEEIVKLAKHISETQKEFIERGDYET
jgi:hypothetical protein